MVSRQALYRKQSEQDHNNRAKQGITSMFVDIYALQKMGAFSLATQQQTDLGTPMRYDGKRLLLNVFQPKTFYQHLRSQTSSLANFSDGKLEQLRLDHRAMTSTAISTFFVESSAACVNREISSRPLLITFTASEADCMFRDISSATAVCSSMASAVFETYP